MLKYYKRVEIIENTNHALVGKTGYVRGHIQVKGYRGINQELLSVRLDTGYEDPSFPYPGKINTKYDVLVNKNSVRELGDNSYPQAITKRSCICCHKPCYASLPPEIVYDVDGKVVCEDCKDKYYIGRNGNLTKLHEKQIKKQISD